MKDIYTFAYITPKKVERKHHRTALMDTSYAPDCVTVFAKNEHGAGELQQERGT